MTSIPLEDAKRQVVLVSRRLGLLHLAFAEVLVRHLGEEEGKKMTARAIKEYGRMVGEKKRELALGEGKELTPETFLELSDLPSIGMHDQIEDVEVDGENRIRAHGCVMGKVWKELGKDDLGRSYCMIDPASCMAFNPELKFVHTKALPDGDPYCELVIRPTTAEDRKEFQTDDTNWTSIEDQNK
jgi:hypothetical protein